MANKSRKNKKQKRGSRPPPGIRTIQGRGGYSIGDLGKKLDGLMKKIPKGTFQKVGQEFGGPLGGLLGSAVSRISGYGDYYVKKNTLGMATKAGLDSENIPMFKGGPHGTVITHREFVRNITVPASPTAFSNFPERLAIDNGNLFPWLSKLSQRYQRYKVRGMVFQYKSTSTDFNNSGTIAISTNYNVVEQPYQRITEVLNSQFGMSSKPSECFLAPIECDPKSHPDGYYIRHENAINQVTDLRMSSIGTINIATEGLSLSAGTVLGQLWVTYEVELISPYLGMDFSIDVNLFRPTAPIASGTTVTTQYIQGVITDSTPESPTIFLENVTYPLRYGNSELFIDNGVTNPTYNSPRFTADFETGTRTYVFTSLQQSSNVLTQWAATRTASTGSATILADVITASSMGGTTTAQRGETCLVQVVRFKPGDTYLPGLFAIAAGDQTQTFSVTRGSTRS